MFLSKRKIKKYITDTISAKLDIQLLAQGRLMSWNIIRRIDEIETLREAEFRIFSQFGDDGIIQYLVNKLDIEHKIFVEFGVQSYVEANTRFLLLNDNWTGLVMDGSSRNVKKIVNDPYYWRHDLIAKEAFITKENINDLLSQYNFPKNIGLLHIDIDGNDYWVWESINVIEPIIVIMEYNALFGPERAITVPYRKDFDRFKAHYSGLYFGASLRALNILAENRGYQFIGCNTAGNNAYFIKKENLGGIKTVTIENGYVKSKFRQSRDKNGNLMYIRGNDELSLLEGLPVMNIINNKIETF